MRFTLPFLAALVLPLTACGGGSGESGPLAVVANFVPAVTHPFFPLTPGSTSRLEGLTRGKFVEEEVRVLAEPTYVLGIACTAVVEDRIVDGALSETTTEWYAQDRGGNVWKLGESSVEWSLAGSVVSADSWRAGERGRNGFVVYPAVLRPGLQIRAGEDVLRVISSFNVATVLAGTFDGCVEIRENPDDPEDTDIILYAPAVGRVLESTSDGRLELASRGR